MFTHRNNEKDNERGALMIEAIALLGLMTMMSPMVVRQTADRTAEMEEVAIAGQMKEIKDALSNWIEANYQEKAKEFSAGNKVDESFAVSAADLAPYLPATYLNGNQFRGNKLVDGFDVGVRAQCTEVSKDDGTECTVANGCYALTNGAIAAIPAGAKCSRYKMTGVVLSKSDNNEEIDDRRASRIASMIGADGGYMRTKKLVESLYGSSSGGSGSNPDGAVPEMQKIVGSQGMWEGDVTKYIPGVSTNIGGKVAATTIFSSGFSGDYLYRKKVDGLPGANSMFTDLDMGGATECEGDGCHKINNAGGLEVVGGKILIRSQNTNDDQGISSGNSFAKIALATDNSHLHLDNSLYLSVASNEANGGGRGAHLNMEQLSTKLYYQGNSGESGYFNASSGMAVMEAGPMNDHWGSSFVQVSSTSGVDIWTPEDMTVTTGKNVDMIANNIILDANYSTNILGRDVWLRGDSTARMGVGQNGKNAGLRMQQSWYTLQSPNTAINGQSNQIELISGTVSAYETTLPGGQVGFSNKTNFIVNNSFLQGGINNNTSSFALTASNFTVNMGGMVNNSPMRQMLYNNAGLELFSAENISANADAAGALRNGHRIAFKILNNSTNAHENLAEIVAMNAGHYRGQAVAVVAGNTREREPLVAFYGNSGRISGVFFQPERMQYGNNTYGNMIVERARVTINENTGLVNNTNGWSTSSINSDTAAVDIEMGALGGTYRPYHAHIAKDYLYNKFRVDPGFTSVMNDIKLTSRGGARLSEALPNYILKGIYELSNSYGSGPWPCSPKTSGQTNCRFAVPYYTRKALGLSSGGWEFNCGGTGDGGSGNHPIVNGGGGCSCSSGSCDGSDGSYSSGKYVTFDYRNGAENSTYTECPSGSFCWAHPFLGMVPAPGRWVQYYSKSNPTASRKPEKLYAQDEGVCPDGYQAVITVTPTVFELGKVSFVNSNKKPSDASVAYNPGWQNYANANIADVTGIMQQATKLGLIVTPVLIKDSGGQLAGWQIAMGTVTPVSTDINSDGYIWNAGGIPANSWSAIAHTYCYFNPQRFNMPNMRFMKLNDDGSSTSTTGGSGVILTPTDNPMLERTNFMN